MQGNGGDHRISRDAVSGVSPDELPFKVIEHIWMGFETPYEPDPRYDELTEGQRSLYGLQWAAAEIHNGGFAQFLTNSTGFFAPDLPHAATVVGLPEHVKLFERANGIFAPGEVPRDRTEREEAFDAAGERDGDQLDATLDSLDDTFYKLEAEFDRALEAYVAANPDAFFR